MCDKDKKDKSLEDEKQVEERDDLSSLKDKQKTGNMPEELFD